MAEPTVTERILGFYAGYILAGKTDDMLVHPTDEEIATLREALDRQNQGGDDSRGLAIWILDRLVDNEEPTGPEIENLFIELHNQVVSVFDVRAGAIVLIGRILMSRRP